MFLLIDNYIVKAKIFLCREGKEGKNEMQSGSVVFAFAARPTRKRALCRDVICLCLPTALVSPGAPSAELVPLA